MSPPPPQSPPSPSNPSAESNGAEVRSVDRAIQLLEILADSAGELGVSELGRRLNVHKATASRLLSTLARHGLVEQNPFTSRYRLGVSLVHLAAASSSRMDIVRQVRPVLEDLSERAKEAAGLAVLERGSVIYVDEVAAPWSVGVSWVGRRAPFHCTSSGQVFLAWSRDRLLERALRKPLEGFTPATITDPDALRAELDLVRKRGYAKSVEEIEEGLVAVAAPIHQADGTVVAAMSLSGPAFRLRPQDVPRTGAMVAEAAEAASRRLGHTARRR